MPDQLANGLMDGSEREALFDAYHAVVDDICHGCNWARDDVRLSTIAQQGAFAEVTKDLKILRSRRAHEPLSYGKVAGVVAFRFARWNIIHVGGVLLENERAIKLNALAALAVACKHILHIDIADVPKDVRRELNDTFLRRHVNQETLALVFDTLIARIVNSQTLWAPPAADLLRPALAAKSS